MDSEEYAREYVKKYRRTLYHPVGSARCGRDGDPEAGKEEGQRQRENTHREKRMHRD